MSDAFDEQDKRILEKNKHLFAGISKEAFLFNKNFKNKSVSENIKHLHNVIDKLKAALDQIVADAESSTTKTNLEDLSDLRASVRDIQSGSNTWLNYIVAKCNYIIDEVSYDLRTKKNQK